MARHQPTTAGFYGSAISDVAHHSHRFAVWAPAAQKVQVVTGPPGWDVANTAGTSSTLCIPHKDGWWTAEVPLPQACDYMYSLDDGPLRPDPRSAWQPHGVHQPSRVFNPSAYQWATDADAAAPWAGAVLYELHVGTFTPEGTLAAARQRLPYLRDLGVTIVQLMPVAAFEGQHGWGYDGVSWYAVHAPYGGPLALQEFVDAAHNMGIGVSLDVVYNHMGPSGNYACEFGPYFTDSTQTPWGPAINLSGKDSLPVREFVIDNALRWFTDFRIDALRLDAVHALHDDSPQHILAELAERVSQLSLELGRPLSLIAESDANDVRTITATDEIADVPAAQYGPAQRGTPIKGLGMTAQWADDIHHAVHAATSQEDTSYYRDFHDPKALPQALTRAFWHAGTWSSFRDSQWGTPVDPTRYKGRSFVAYTTTHDQIGNRAMGDRPSQYLPQGILAGRAALVLLSPYTPMLFMGEEWACLSPWQFFVDFTDEQLKNAVRQGRRREFQRHGWTTDEVPDPTASGAFTVSTLDWSTMRSQTGQQMLSWYRDLLRLRREVPDLADDDLTAATCEYDQEAGLVVLRRNTVSVAVNLSDQAHTVAVTQASAADSATAAPSGELLTAWAGAVCVDNALHLPPQTTAVVTGHAVILRPLPIVE